VRVTDCIVTPAWENKQMLGAFHELTRMVYLFNGVALKSTSADEFGR